MPSSSDEQNGNFLFVSRSNLQAARDLLHEYRCKFQWGLVPAAQVERLLGPMFRAESVQAEVKAGHTGRGPKRWFETDDVKAGLIAAIPGSVVTIAHCGCPNIPDGNL
jgi:hypothetical protein